MLGRRLKLPRPGNLGSAHRDPGGAHAIIQIAANSGDRFQPNAQRHPARRSPRYEKYMRRGHADVLWRFSVACSFGNDADVNCDKYTPCQDL
jgi:hypothetical protein